MTPDRVRRLATLALSLGTAVPAVPAAPVAAQAPRVRVEFQLADPLYRQQFNTSQIRQIEDSATAMVVRVLTRHLGFLSFSTDRADSTRVLSVILDQKERGSRSPWGARGLHLFLTNLPFEPGKLYWRRFRSLGVTDTVGSVSTFLGELGLVLHDLDDAAWRVLVTDLLSQISIADTNAAAWADPPGSASPNQWLIPLRRESACFDPDRSKLRIRNEVVTRGRRFIVTAKPLDIVPEDTVGVPPTLKRFRGQIRAPLDSPATALAAPLDSIHVKAVFVTEYTFDHLECAALARPEGGR